MRSALVYLWITTRKNAVRRFLRNLLRPRLLLGKVAIAGSLAFLVFGMKASAEKAEVAEQTAAALVASYLAVVFVLSVLGGFAERGIPFAPAEVDFLFPGPYPRRSLVLHHVLGLYPATLLMAIIPFGFFGAHAKSPGWGLLGIVLCLLVAQNLRLTVSLLSIHVGERTFRRLAGPVRFLIALATIALIALLAAAITSVGGMREAILAVLSSKAAQVALYPAVAASNLAAAHGASDALPHLLGLLAVLGGTLALLLAVQVNFLEASITASERMAVRRERWKKGRGAAVAAAERPATRVRLPALAAFSGAGAVTWKNLIVARRSARTLVVSTILSLLFLVPAFLSGKGSDTAALIPGAMLPLFFAGSHTFDFRGDREHWAFLRTLPLSPTRLAVAQVATPTLVALGTQTIYLVVVVVAGVVRPDMAALALCGYVPITATLVTLSNLAVLLARGTGGASFLSILLLLVDGLLLALVVAGLGSGGVPWPLAALAGAGLQIAILAGSLVWLGAAFARQDPTPDAA